MRVLVVGGGPAALSFALALKQSSAEHSVLIIDHDLPGSMGWGITLPRDVMKRLEIDVAHRDIDTFHLSHQGRSFLATPIDSVALARHSLVEALRRRCLAFDVSFTSVARKHQIATSDLRDFDLVVGADGANSLVRATFRREFGEFLSESTVRHLWLATSKGFGTGLARLFSNHGHWLFGAAAYQHDESLSTFVVECTEAAWRGAGFSQRSVAEACDVIGEIFNGELDGHRLCAQEGLGWRRFLRVRNACWTFQNVVLIGDAAHTTHFSKGHGTAAAVLDGVCLAKHLATHVGIQEALSSFERERLPQMAAARSKANHSETWYQTLLSDYEKDPNTALKALTDLERGREERKRMR